MGSSDFSSMEMPSEPPDIGNWFSSYVYQSPHLSNEDKGEEDFQDFDWSIVPETQQSEDIKVEDSLERRNLVLRKCNNVGEGSSPRKPPSYDVQLPETEESLKGRTYHLAEDHTCCLQDSCVSIVPETEEREDINTEKIEKHNLLKRQDFLVNSCENISGDNCSREVLEYADSVLPVSEPPDLKNWFDSYVYESPSLDAGHELGLWSIMDRNVEEDNDAPNHAEGKKEVLLSKSIGTAEREELTSKSAASGGLAKNFSEDNDHQHEYYHMENRNVNPIQQVDKLNESTTDQDISCRILHENTKQEHDHKSTTRKNSPRKKHLLHEENLKSLDMEAACDENYDPGMRNGKLAKNCNNIDEETSRNEAADEGFISTRKSRSKHTQKENSFRNVGLIKPEIHRIGVNSNAMKKTPPKREALQERTNIQSLNNMFEAKTGKWKCPQNTKPDIGPPLKQLRLDQWVRRVRKL